MGRRTILFGVLFFVVVAMGLWFEQSSFKKKALRTLSEAIRSRTRPAPTAPDPNERISVVVPEEIVEAPDEPVASVGAVDEATQVMVRNALIDYVIEKSNGTAIFPYTGPFTGYERPGTEFQTLPLLVEGIREEVTFADDSGRRYESCLFLRGSAHRWDLDLVAEVANGRVVGITEKFHEVGPGSLSPRVGFVPISR